MPELLPPSGCSWCGVAERDHVQRWHPVARWHKWTAPSQEQIKDRMIARRSRG